MLVAIGLKEGYQERYQRLTGLRENLRRRGKDIVRSVTTENLGKAIDEFTTKTLESHDKYADNLIQELRSMALETFEVEEIPKEVKHYILLPFARIRYRKKKKRFLKHKVSQLDYFTPMQKVLSRFANHFAEEHGFDEMQQCLQKDMQGLKDDMYQSVVNRITSLFEETLDIEKLQDDFYYDEDKAQSEIEKQFSMPDSGRYWSQCASSPLACYVDRYEKKLKKCQGWGLAVDNKNKQNVDTTINKIEDALQNRQVQTDGGSEQ